MQQLTIEQNKLMGISCRVVNVAKPYTTDARPHILQCVITHYNGGRLGRDRMLVRFITAFHH